ncbi:hypothetical protein BDV93DRAFT_608853 [Ceratobasidium sp. AG-I]|nr:hypothetical protein BDV93DRAFT_608853 [Ceratobasidium sp. AG-I]
MIIRAIKFLMSTNCNRQAHGPSGQFNSTPRSLYQHQRGPEAPRISALALMVSTHKDICIVYIILSIFRLILRYWNTTDVSRNVRWNACHAFEWPLPTFKRTALKAPPLLFSKTSSTTCSWTDHRRQQRQQEWTTRKVAALRWSVSMRLHPLKMRHLPPHVY